MKINYALLFIFSLISSINVSAQTIQENDLVGMKKYWFYHYRLLNDFMIKGDKSGETQIMSERAVNSPNSYTAKWGDQTICLSQYISVLATEYKLLKNSNQPTDTTLQELYFSLRAFNRLDYTAETNTKDCSLPNTLNGFFMRDDVHSDFFDPTVYPDHQKLSHGVTSARLVNIVESDFNEHAKDNNNRLNEMSQDQVMHLMMGFALVRNCLSPGITYKKNGIPMPLNDVYGNTDIHDEAYKITDRIISRIKDAGWTVLVPGKIPPSGFVYRGYNALYIAYGLAEVGNFIKFGNSTNLIYLPVVHRYSNPSYQDALSLNSCIQPFTAPYPPIPPPPFPPPIIPPLPPVILVPPLTWMQVGQQSNYFLQDDYKRDLIATIGDSWYTHVAPISVPNPMTYKQLYESQTPYYWLTHPLEWTTALANLTVQTVKLPEPVTLAEISEKVKPGKIDPYNYLHFTLLYQILHGSNAFIHIPGATYASLLNSAPACGPSKYGVPTNYEWSADSRVYDAEDRGSLTSIQGEFNGLDFMLYYNLYHNIVPSTVPYINYMDRIINVTYPTTSNPIFGNISNPAHLIAFNTISASNIINNNADVIYHAGNEISLLPGFSTQTGANFQAFIQPISCNDYLNPIYR